MSTQNHFVMKIKRGLKCWGWGKRSLSICGNDVNCYGKVSEIWLPNLPCLWLHAASPSAGKPVPPPTEPGLTLCFALTNTYRDEIVGSQN